MPLTVPTKGVVGVKVTAVKSSFQLKSPDVWGENSSGLIAMLGFIGWLNCTVSGAEREWGGLLVKAAVSVVGIVGVSEAATAVCVGIGVAVGSVVGVFVGVSEPKTAVDVAGKEEPRLTDIVN